MKDMRCRQVGSSVVWATFEEYLSLRVRRGIASTFALAIMAAMLAACGDRGVVSSVVPTQTRQAADDCNIYQSIHRASASSSRSLQYVNCPGGGGGGTGTGGGGSGGGGGDCVSAGTCPKTSCADDPTQAKCANQVACAGTPQQCAGVPCSGSPETISDNFPAPANGQANNPFQYITVMDINSLWIGVPNAPTGTGEYGWMYLGSDGNYYIQLNYANKIVWGGAIGVALGKFFNVGGSATSPSGYGNIFKWNGSLAPGSTPIKCEAKGQQFLA